MAIWLEWINNIVNFPATLATIVGMLFLLTGSSMNSAWFYTLCMLIMIILILIGYFFAKIITSYRARSH
jgi:hypothetical protein